MGIAEMYLRDSLSADNNKCRNVFGEFFSHSTSCSLAKHVTFNLAMQVPPIKNFYKHIQTMWLDPSSGLWNRQHKSFNNVVEILDTGQKANVFIRRVLSSDTLGVTILGFLQFSSMPGRLQLFDATGAVDVIIPDLQTAQIAPGAFQVTAYKLVVEGYLEAPMDVDNNLRCSPLSWYSLLKGTSRSLEASNNFSFFLIFSIKEARMVSYIKPPDFFTRIGEGQLLSPNLRPLKEYTCNFDILCVIHKHPLKSKSFGKQTGDCSFTFYVEAVRLPYRISMLHEQRKLFEDKEAVQNSWACTISVLSLSDFLDMSGKETSGKGEHQGYMSYPALLKRISSATRPKVERLLFQFSDLHQTAFQNIRIGQFYLVPSLQDPAIQTLHSGSLFWSFIADKDCGRSVEAEKMQVGLPDNGSNLPLVDVILKLPLTCQSEFSSSLNDARAVLSPVLSIKEVIDHGKFAIYKEHANDTGVLKGSLLSLCGIVGTREDLEICGLRTFTMKDLSSQLITVSCNSDQYLPLGFGPGAVVAIHRALLQILTEGEVSIKCIPSTLIEVCCVEADSFMGKSDCFKEIHFDKDQCEAQKLEHTTIKSLRLSSCINSSVPKLFKICCKVVSVDTLLLERIEDVNTCVRSWGVATYKVRLVSLQLDDGSGLAACGAKGDVAARLLSIPGQNSTRKRSMFDNMCFKQLNAIVKKYKRVLYQTVDPQQDPSSNGFMVEGAEGQGLDFADKKFIHAIVQRACHAGPLDVVAEHQIHENTGGELCKGQRRDIQSAKKTLGLSLLAKKVDVVKYETHMAAICVDLETTLGKEAFLQSGGNY